MTPDWVIERIGQIHNIQVALSGLEEYGFNKAKKFDWWFDAVTKNK